MALADTVTLPSFAPSGVPDTRGQLYIATDGPPWQAQPWPVLVPLPAGWHVVTQAEAAQIAQGRGPSLSFTIAPPPPSGDVAEAVALSSSPPEAERRRQGRPPRDPRPPRPPRAPRRARTVRASRLFRAERAPRAGRLHRKPRPPRKPRKPRKPRARYQKTRTLVGMCKGPSCTCWTPGGCIGETLVTALQLYPKDCLRGPCYSYEACVSGKCAFHVGCTINTILQFWARQFRAAVTYAQPVIAPVVAAGTRALVPFSVVAPPAAEVPTAPGIPFGAITAQCPPGMFWTLGLTGCRCVEAGTPVAPATKAQIIACLGYDPEVGAGADF